jgi:hypothetical protein
VRITAAQLALSVTLAALACAAPSIESGPPGPPVVRAAESTTFAIIGDFGEAGPAEAAVAALVHGWRPDFIATTGDNNYPDGMRDTIDDNVGQYYHDYLGDYAGRYGAGAPDNRFFPVPGNHDWHTHDLAPYREYFHLPGNERYYAVSWGPVDLFLLDSDRAEPDGIDADSKQARWLKDALARSTAPWQLVLLHHAPHSSGRHGSTPALQWPFAAWGADAVIAGHDHAYERIERDGVVYLVNGLGGHGKRYEFTTPVAGSAIRFNEAHGAMRVHATAHELRFEFVAVDGRQIDARALVVAP